MTLSLGFQGDDEVIECVWNERLGQVEVRESINYDDKHNEVLPVRIHPTIVTAGVSGCCIGFSVSVVLGAKTN